MVRCYLQFFQKAFLYKDYSHGTDKVKLGGSCLLWVMSTEISVDVAVDIAVDIAVDSRSIVGRQSVDSRSMVGR